MRLVAESGLWTTGPAHPATTPLTAVLEVSGAVLSWTIDDPPDDAATHIAFTDVSRADWLWRVVGETGHVALTSALAAHPAGDLELAGVDVVSGSTAPLRRLALGHWLRRWWPASQRDGIAGLDRALLDVEVAVLTAGVQGFFTDDTLDSDVAGLLAPHAAALLSHLRTDDRRVLELVRSGARLADEAGLDDMAWAELSAAVDDSSVVATLPSGRRDDYALAAGTDGAPRGAASIGRGVASINWGAVPPGIFDAAEDTVDWSVEPAGPGVVAVIRAAVVGPDAPTDIPVRVNSGEVSGAGALDAGGRATLALADAHRHAMAQAAAWNHDWPRTSVVIGADVDESRHTRDRVRRWVRERLDRPPADAFLAEILAGESAY
ncbi:hypothetical protein [Mycobacterium persicum]|nr:hypothetical protein [Mycobacterium persicum]KZS84325.1 hypothetical protein A4G31_12110 [Mycobacterium persicum]ORB53505.1 hypothetical protein BST40_07950 [Mycobacterium persicum]ORB89977.1 hypothetical protein B1T49_12975 [Mycobacterium persicum]ORB95395.1 hypothetical protein B1T44_13840 [Mycobacterium persicum]ORC02154.1 hypothetical protein B1T48_13670 [Mycobacterium persicum]